LLLLALAKEGVDPYRLKPPGRLKVSATRPGALSARATANWLVRLSMKFTTTLLWISLETDGSKVKNLGPVQDARQGPLRAKSLKKVKLTGDRPR
jgi:hypothetical protein